MEKTALILGASGRFGRNCAKAFEAKGWNVIRFKRGNDLEAAAKDVQVIVNGFNPAYPDWAKFVPGLTTDVIEAAKVSGATVIVPGNVYPFGKDAPSEFAADTPHGAQNSLGIIRIEMEAAFKASGVQTIVLRGGDFLDSEASGNWFDSVIVKNVQKGKFVYPGPLDRVHAWAYLPDMARAAVELAEMRGNLPGFTDVPFPGFRLTGAEMMAHVEAVSGVQQRHKGFPWWVMMATRPVWPMARGLWEMRYLWSKPHWLSGDAFFELRPEFRQTPVKEAIACALKIDIDENQSVTRGNFDGQIRSIA